MKLSIKEMTLVAMFAAIAAAAAIMLRFTSPLFVPYSLLPLVTMLAGAIIGSRLGALSMVLYVLMGLVGLPVLASPPYGGITYILKPTFGFLIGSIVAAYVIGLLLQNKRNASLAAYLGAMLAGLAVIYLIGLPYLWAILNFYLNKPAGLMVVLKISFFPYIGFDLVKAVIAAVVARSIVRRVPYLF